jgi:leader peptidase (prepilin peptidase)/N-methyltransferase
VELGTGLLFALSYWYFGLSIHFAVIAFYGSLFLVIGIIDLEHQLILDKVSYPAMVLALVIAIFRPPTALIDLNLGWPWAGIVSSLMGGAIGLLFLLFAYVITLAIYKSEAIGFGDVKLAGLIGLVTGPRLVLLSLTLGAILGGVTGIILLSLKRKGRRDPLSFGSFLAIATMITLLWGSDILNWYLGLIRF